MTVVVGLAHDGRVVIGADAAAVADDHLTRYTHPKVFHLGPYLIGFADSFRAGQIIQYRLRVPEQRCDDDHEHLCTVFVDELRKTLHKAGALKHGDGDEASAVLLVGYRGHLYEIDTDLHVGRSVDGFEAIGIGAPYALGSLHAPIDGTPAYRVGLALSAAATYSTAVSPPFTILDN